MHGLLSHPLQHPLGVIAVARHVVAGRQTVRRTLLLHLVQLGVVELGFSIVPQSCVWLVHRKHGASVPVGGE